MTEAVIVSAARTAVGRANKGTLADYRPEDMGAAAVAEAIRRAPGLDPTQIDDLIMGCAMPEGSQGLNMARIIAMRAGLPDEVMANERVKKAYLGEDENDEETTSEEPAEVV